MPKKAAAKSGKKAPNKDSPLPVDLAQPPDMPSSDGPSYAVGELLKFNISSAGQPPGVTAEVPGQDAAKNKRRGKTDKRKNDKGTGEGGARAIALSKEIATSSSPVSSWALGADPLAVQRAAADAQMAYLHGVSMAYASAAAAAAAAAYSAGAAGQSPGASLGMQPSGPTHTTVMLRNIPNRYTRDMLVNRLNEKFDNQYDFVYLPIDFNSKCNVGYAFINFRSPHACQLFTAEFHNVKTRHCLPGFSSQKVCEVSPARVQGRDANMENLRDEKFIEKLVERPEWQPLFFNDAGEQVPFTNLVNIDGKGHRRTSSRANKAQQAPNGAAQMPPSSPFSSMLPGFPPYGGGYTPGYPPGSPGYPFPPYSPGYPPLSPPGVPPGVPPLDTTSPQHLAAVAEYSARAARLAASQSPSYIDPAYLAGGLPGGAAWDDASAW
eukprot:CAMPEP_0178405276 /NCGR_PEP_ID=MMETSP0689_2-20121128/18316_1 /TAXON_ID=160604 /ORGANISM="Amphidinium massartii, Strain CS-259" /LENGTH=435 /DNA_ID=CAMNT_0020026287 /DNA_START=120 /DNA_END=1424 /DNA_ORIENTATION=-